MVEEEKCVKCVICGCDEAVPKCTEEFIDVKGVNCPVCGTYMIAGAFIRSGMKDILTCSGDECEEKKALLRYHVQQHNISASSKRDSNVLRVTPEFCKKIFNNPFPNPIEQVNYLMTFLGNTISSTYKSYYVEKSTIENLISATASIDYDNVWRIVDHAKELNFVKHKESSLDLTIQGWQKYEELKRNNPDSTIAFMAMQFGLEMTNCRIFIKSI